MHGNDFAGQTPVADAIKELKIDYPVAHDEGKKLWMAYNIRFRPSHVLINPEGAVVDQGVGLVTTKEVQARIEALLKK